MAALFSISEQQIVCGDRTVSYLRTGNGPALVLLHGIGSAAASWQAQLEELSARYDVIAWNAPGYGRSTPLESNAPKTEDYAKALAVFLDALEIDTCFLAGHSLGSLIAARFARLHPDRIIALSLASCALGHARHDPEKRQQLLDNRLNDVGKLGMAGMAEKRGPRLLTPKAGAQMIRTVVDNMAQADPHGYSQAARMLSAGDMLGDIENIEPVLPIQILYGLQDIITPPEANERAARARANISAVAIPDAGHLVYVEQAGPFNNALNVFNTIHTDATTVQGVSNG